jgi:hypothetical protein
VFKSNKKYRYLPQVGTSTNFVNDVGWNSIKSYLAMFCNAFFAEFISLLSSRKLLNRLKIFEIFNSLLDLSEYICSDYERSIFERNWTV